MSDADAIMHDVIETLQDPEEIAAFVSLLRDEGVKSYLEIGAKFGGSLWRVASALPVGSRVVAVDLPGGTRMWKESEAALKSTISTLRDDGYDARVVWGDSTDPVIVREVQMLGPFDAVFIDANHTRAYVAQDWENYGQRARIVAFHDIVWEREPEFKGVRIDVPAFWNEIKNFYLYREFKFCKTKRNNGIGVLFK